MVYSSQSLSDGEIAACAATNETNVPYCYLLLPELGPPLG